MGNHPNLPSKPLLYHIYEVPDGRSVVIDNITMNLRVKCGNCFSERSLDLTMNPNPCDGNKYRWYHLGCLKCQTHAIDFRIWGKELVALTYSISHSIMITVDDYDVHTKTKD